DTHMRFAFMALGYVGPGAILTSMYRGLTLPINPVEASTILDQLLERVKAAPKKTDEAGFHYWDIELDPKLKDIVPVLAVMPWFRDKFISYLCKHWDEEVNVITDLTPVDYLDLIEADIPPV